jgi:hypothetical protein
MDRLIRPQAVLHASGGGLLLGLSAVLLFLPACTWDGHFTLLGYSTRPNYDTCYKTIRVNIFKDPTFWAVVPAPGLEQNLTWALVHEIEQKTPWKVSQNNPDLEVTGVIRSFTKSVLNYNQLNEQREVETTLVCEVVWRDLRTGQILSTPAMRAIEGLSPGGILPPGTPDPLAIQGAGLPNPLAPPPASTGGGTGPPNPAFMNQQGPGAPPNPLPGNPMGTLPINPLAAAANLPSPGAIAQAPVSPLTMPATGTFQGGLSAPGPARPGGLPGAPGAPPPPLGATGSTLIPAVGAALIRSVAHYRPELGESITSAQQKNIDRMVAQIVSMMEKPW